MITTTRTTRTFSLELYRHNGSVLRARDDKPLAIAGLDEFVCDCDEAYELLVRYRLHVTHESPDHWYPGGTYVDIDPDRVWLVVGVRDEERTVELPKQVQDEAFEVLQDDIAGEVEV